MQNNGKTLSIVSLILGIASIVLAWFYMINIAALVSGIVGIILAAKGKKGLQASGEPTGMATAGLVLSIIGLVLPIIGFFTCTLCVLCVASAANSSTEVNGALNELNSIIQTATAN